jgi:GTP-binding protein Era
MVKKKTSPEVSDRRAVGAVALVGRPNVGKSTLVNALVGEKIAATTHKPQTTRRMLRGVVTRGATQIILVDTPGVMQPKHDLDRFMINEALDAARGVEAIALVVEATNKGQGSPIDPRDLEALTKIESAKAPNVPIILVINKIDCLDDKAVLLPLIAAWNEARTFHALVPVSATDKDGLDTLFEVLAGVLPDGDLMFPADSITDASEREIASEIIREKAMLELKEEIPYRIAVVIELFDESRREDPKKPLIHVAAVLNVERESQKRIVVGKGGERIKAIGMRARKDLERLFDAQVMLELFVRTEPGWTESDKALKKLGYHR